ncbi:hypothetical protein ACSBR2_014153 [Camellia fascicularis]
MNSRFIITHINDNPFNCDFEKRSNSSDEFESMSAFLKVVDAKEETDLDLKVWVKQVRDAAHDTEDVLDKFRLHLVDHHGDGFGGFVLKI